MWYAFLQDNYKTREEWTAYAETYGLHERLGYATPDEAWDANPFIQGSSDPADYSRADLTQAYSKRMRRWSAEKLDRESRIRQPRYLRWPREGVAGSYRQGNRTPWLDAEPVM